MPFPGTQQLAIEFSGGLNSKVADFALDQPYLEEAVNAVYNQYGQIDKRTGFTAIPNTFIGGTITNGQAVTTFNNELCLMDGKSLYSYDEDNAVWMNRGALFSTINDQIRVLNTKIATQANPDCTTLNGLQLYFWEDDRSVPVISGAGVRYSLMDIETGAFIISDKFVYPLGFRPKVLAVPQQNQFNLYYQASANIIFLNTINTNRPQFLSPLTQIVSDGDGHGAATAYDVCMIGNQPTIAYSAQDGIRTWSPGGGSVLQGAGVHATCIAMNVTTNGVVYLAYTDVNGGTYAVQLNTGIFSPVKLDNASSCNITVIEDLNPGNANITWEIPAGDGFEYSRISNATFTFNNQVAVTGLQLKVGLASKAFKINNNIFVNTIFATTLQATYFTQCVTQQQVALGSWPIIAKHSPLNGGNYRNNTLLSQCDLISDNNFVFAGQRKGPFTSYQNAQTVNLGVAGYTIDFNAANAFNNVAANNNLHIVGGIKKIYDGISCVEDNFNYFAELTDGYGCDVSLEEGGNLPYNSLTPPNLLQYLIVYEWTDNYGQVQRGTPSVANGVSITGSGLKAVLTIATLTLTDKLNPRSPVSIAIYRTQSNLPIFYKITDDNNPLVNDPTVETVTYIDNMSDGYIAANENLYISSQLANTAPPSCSLISLYQNRLIINSTEDRNVLFYSQNKFEQDQYNTLALDWNTSFVEGITSEFNDQLTGITTIGKLDNALAIFKETSIFILNGDGPNSLDTSGQFNDAQLLVSDTGCTNANSLCFITQTPKLPGGLLFKSSKGIYLLGRDTSIYYIGAPVEKYNNLTITSANLLSKKNQVVFTTLEGIALVYNYFFDAWTTWKQLPAIDATVWQDSLVILTPDGTVMIQDNTDTVYQDTFSDGTVYPVQRIITSPWISFTGSGVRKMSYQCVYNCQILGKLKGPHILQVDVAKDGNRSILQTNLINSSVAAANTWGSLPIWGSNGTWGSNGFANYQYQINFQYNIFRCQAIQLTLTDIDQENSPGFTLNGLTFEVLPLVGGYRVPTSNLAGGQ